MNLRSKTETYFDDYAEFFDADYGRDVGDIEFYVDLAESVDGPVLEPACGAGRVYLELLRAGVDAYGFDLSENMLSKLRERAAEEGLAPQVRQADVTDFSYDREFDLVIIPYRTILNLVTLEDQRQALTQIYDALSPDGTLALNFFVPDSETVCGFGEETEVTFEHDGEEYRRIRRTEIVDEVHHVVRVNHELRTADGELVTANEYGIKLTTKNEFELLLSDVGYSDWEVYGGFDYGGVAPEKELVWVVEK